MRQVLFHKDFISHYEDSPIADVLGDFDKWMRSSGYYDPYARRHLGYVRRALERAAPLPDDRRFDAIDLDRMFRSRVRPRSFAASSVVPDPINGSSTDRASGNRPMHQLIKASGFMVG